MKPKTALKAIEMILNDPAFCLKGIYSHFATSSHPNDVFALHQIDLFKTMKTQAPLKNTHLIWHMSNSGGCAFYKNAHFDMVRPALLSFGYGESPLPPPLNALKPCLSLKSKISYFKVVEKGTGISYNHTYVTKKRSRIVTIPLGYGDGYPRALSNKGYVLIRGKRFPIAGLVCMDQFMVDIGDAEAFVGDEVVLIGSQGEETITASDLATLAQTDIRDILCSFSLRLPRKYLSV